MALRLPRSPTTGQRHCSLDLDEHDRRLVVIVGGQAVEASENLHALRLHDLTDHQPLLIELGVGPPILVFSFT